MTERTTDDCSAHTELALTVLGIYSWIQRRVTPHMMRHTFATRFLEDGGDLRAAR